MPSALPGAIAAVFLLAASVTFPASWVILAVYRRAVHRSMRTRNRTNHAPHHVSNAIGTSAAPPDGQAKPLRGDPAVLVAEMQRRPWMAAAAYAAAGLAYAAAMTVVLLTAATEWGGPIRFVLMTAIFAWPVVLTLGIVATPSRRARVAIPAAYLAGLFALGWIGALGSAEGVFSALLLWAVYNGPATILLLAFLSRRIRAAGPLVFAFMLLSMTGAIAILNLFNASDSSLNAASILVSWMGLGAAGTAFALLGIGAIVFAALGWTALQWIRRRYEAKTLSDEAVTLAALWLTFTAAHSIGLPFENPFAILMAPIPFAAFALVGSVTLDAMGPYGGEPPRLLLLRSFSIGSAGERLFDVLEKHWRRVGSIQMIAGYDLASRTVEPHELLDFVTGRLARRFIDGPDALERRLREMDLAPDRDGRFRVNDFFCYEDTWRAVLSALVSRSHAVLMDLRGFTRDNAGCIFEIQELGRTMPIEQVVFVVDRTTDEPLLRATLRSTAALADTSLEPQVFTLDAVTPRTTDALLGLLARAAHRRTGPGLPNRAD